MPSPIRLIRALDEEEADRGREHADDRAGREREPHEVGVKDGHGKGRASWPGRAAGGPSKTMPPRTSTSRSTNVLDRAELVRDEEDRHVPSSRVQLGEQRRERLLRVDVDAGGRLVEHEQVRLAGERLRDERALLLAAGEASRAARVERSPRPTRSIAVVDALRGRAARSGPSRPRRATRPAATTSRDGDRRLDPELRALRRGSRSASARWARPAGSPKSAAVPVCGRSRPSEEPQQRRLAAAVRAGDRDELALRRSARSTSARTGGPPG